jgi:excisionase family DNA binding protein
MAPKTAASTLSGGRQQEDEQILTPQEVADRLKIPLSAIYEKTRDRCSNPLPVHQVGKYLRFEWNAVLEWFRQQRRKT